MADKQVDFPRMQKEDSRVAPFMLGLCVVCILIVAIILATDVVEGSFIGPW